MADTKQGRPLWFDLREMPKVIAKSLDRPAIESRPKSRFRNGHATSVRHALVIVGDAGDHVDMGVDVEGHGD